MTINFNHLNRIIDRSLCDVHSHCAVQPPVSLSHLLIDKTNMCRTESALTTFSHLHRSMSIDSDECVHLTTLRYYIGVMNTCHHFNLHIDSFAINNEIHSSSIVTLLTCVCRSHFNLSAKQTQSTHETQSRLCLFLLRLEYKDHSHSNQRKAIDK